jgi:hypothetical protein
MRASLEDLIMAADREARRRLILFVLVFAMPCMA